MKDIRLIEYVAIGEDRDGDSLFNCTDLGPVCETGINASLFTYPTVAGEDLSACTFEHFGVCYGLFDSRKYTELGGDRY